MRSRSASERRFGAGRGLPFDCWDVSRDGRKDSCALAAHRASSSVRIRFDYDRAMFLSRSQNLAGHAMLSPGNGVGAPR